MDMENTNLAAKQRAQAIVDSLAGFCHALGQPATVLLSSVELLKMDGIDAETQSAVLDACYDSVLEIRNLLAEMKNRREYLAEAYLHSADLGGTIAAMPEWSERMPMPASSPPPGGRFAFCRHDTFLPK